VGDFAHRTQCVVGPAVAIPAGGITSTNMRITFLTSLTVAAAGSLQNLLGLSQNALSVNEPVWLLVWGVALMSLAGSLRAKFSTRRSRRT
jgi:hypothetical protein